jgi:NAD(P)-dependent dehydrogenase (short-subunit alcohol dehydrogenase family)
MRVEGISAVVTGGASGLGLATVKRLVADGADVIITDLESSDGEAVAADVGARFIAGDVTSAEDMENVFNEAGELRALVHCAGAGGAVRLVERDGSPGSLETFQRVINLNLVGTFNVLRLAAVKMVANEPIDGERGCCVLTASVAAFEGQIGQIPYASSKAGIVGMTLVAARDLARKYVRVNTIAPGTFDTPLLARLSQEVRDSLAATVPHPSRLGDPDEFGQLAVHIIENAMLNGETIRLDGAIRMAPR